MTSCHDAFLRVLRWVLLRKAIDDQDVAENEDALKVFMSLCSIPTLFEGQPEDGGASDLIAQAVPQCGRMWRDLTFSPCPVCNGYTFAC